MSDESANIPTASHTAKRKRIAYIAGGIGVAIAAILCVCIIAGNIVAIFGYEAMFGNNARCFLCGNEFRIPEIQKRPRMVLDCPHCGVGSTCEHYDKRFQEEKFKRQHGK